MRSARADAAVALNQLLASEDAPAAATEQTLQQLRARVQHLSELLAESESTVLQLTAQEKVLKDEIRRLDSLQGVKDMNAEYAKNVLFKFFESPEREVGSSERERGGLSVTTNAAATAACPAALAIRQALVPVVATLLHLSADEVKRLRQALARDQLPDATGLISAWLPFS